MPPAEEAGRIYRDLAEADPSFLPNLAGALTSLGIRYSEVGRRQDAVPPTEEAVTLAGSRPSRTPPTCPTSPGR